MRQVAVTSVIPAPPQIVFSAIADPKGPFGVSNPFIKMRIVSPQTTGVGTRYHWDFAYFFGRKISFEEVVTEWDEPNRFLYRAVSGPQVDSEIVLRPHKDGSLVSFKICYHIPGFKGKLVPVWLVKLGAHTGLQNIRKYIQKRSHYAQAKRKVFPFA